MLKRSDESKHPCVVPCLRAKVSCRSQWCLLCIFLKCSSYSGSSYLLLVCWICLTWNSVRFARCLFCICCHKHMSFVFYTVDMIYNISWFWDVKPICIPEIKSHWLYYIIHFYTLLDLFLLIFYWGFLHYIHKTYWSVITLFLSVVWYHGNTAP